MSAVDTVRRTVTDVSGTLQPQYRAGRAGTPSRVLCYARTQCRRYCSHTVRRYHRYHRYGMVCTRRQVCHTTVCSRSCGTPSAVPPDATQTLLRPPRVHRRTRAVCKVVRACLVWQSMHRPYGLHEVAGSRRCTPDCIPRPRTKRALRISRARSVTVVCLNSNMRCAMQSVVATTWNG